MKLIDKLVRQAVEDQHSAIRREFKIPGYEKGFRDGYAKALELACLVVHEIPGASSEALVRALDMEIS